MKRILLLALLAIPCFPQNVPQSYFGQDMNTTTTAWPNITQALNPTAPFGVLRLHDDGADLMDIFGNAATGTCNTTTHVYTGCNWTSFDHWISQAAAHSQVVMYAFHKTPNFAGTYTSSPPDDADAKAMVDAIRDRSGCTVSTQTGCIKYWEVWNEPNNDGGTLSSTSSGSPYWSGSIENLVHFARTVHDEVKTVANGGVNGVDPNAMVVGPGAAGWGTYTNLPGGNITVSGACNDSAWNANLNSPEAFICEYLRRTGSGSGDSTGAAYTDAMTIHIYPNASVIATIAESNIAFRMANFIKVFGDLGITLCPHGTQGKGGGSCTQMFASEDSWGAVSSSTYPRIGPDATNSIQVSGSGLTGSWRDDQSAYLIKEYVLGWSLGLDMYVWYGWDFQNGWGNQWCKAANVNIGCDLASSGNPSYPYQQKSAWSYGAVQNWMIGTQMSGTCSADGNTTYSCNFGGPWGYSSRLYWNSAQTGVALTPAGFSQQRDMYGNITTFTGTITPNYYPVLLEHLAPARRYAGGWN